MKQDKASKTLNNLALSSAQDLCHMSCTVLTDKPICSKAFLIGCVALCLTPVLADAGVGVPVKADASFSVSRALQLQLPKQLEILEEVSEYASREYSLERALDKMQVSCTLQLLQSAPKRPPQLQSSACTLRIIVSCPT